MWLSRLDLLAFGRFSNVRLKLGPGFHLVYGPNEAGKSTTLRAIRQLLFGFDERTSDNFVHANPDLRIGGVICDDAGSPLEIIRRKSRKDSLRAADDLTVVDEKRLQDLLCEVNEVTFSQRYGIDYEQLTQGGKEIATGSGDLGEILFAAGSGVMNLTAIQKQLNEEAAEIFRPRGEKQRLNRALVELQVQRDIVTNKLLPVAEWEEADRLQQETQSRLDQITGEWTILTAERERQLRRQKAWPLIQEQSQLEQQLLPFAAVPRLHAEFGAQRQEAVLLLKQARSQESTASEALTHAVQQLETLAIPAGFLQRAEELASLVTDWGSYRKAQLDRPQLQQQSETLRAELVARSQTLGRPLDVLQLEEVVLDRALRTRLSQLGRQQASLAQACQQAESRRDRLVKTADELQQRLATLPDTRSLDDLRNTVRQIRLDGDLEAQLSKIEAEIDGLRPDSDRQRDQLLPGTGSISNLESIRVPTSARIAKAVADFDANQADQAVLRAKQAELEGEREQLNREIEVLRQEYQVPTEAELTASRQNRDEIWSQIRQQAATKKGIAAKRIEQFEQALMEADGISDRLRNEADRVAQLADQMAECQTNELRRHETSLRVADLEAARLSLVEQWKSEWPDLHENLLSPREMQTWLVRRETLLQNERLIRRREAEADELRSRIRSHIGLLSILMLGETNNAQTPSAAEELTAAIEKSRSEGTATTSTQAESALARQQLSFGWDQDHAVDAQQNGNVVPESPIQPLVSLTALLIQAEDQIEQDNQIRQARKEAEQSFARIQAEQIEAIEQVERTTSDQAKWRSAWQAEMTALKLDPEASPEVADAHLQALSELLELRKQNEQLLSRIRGIDADAEQFVARVAAACQQIAPDLLPLAIDEQLTSLRSRMAACQRDQATYNDQSARKTHAQEQLETAKQSRLRAMDLIETLRRDAGQTTEPDEPTSALTESALLEILEQFGRIEQQSAARAQLESKQKQVQERLRELAGETSMADFVVEVQMTPLDEVSQTLLQLDRQLAGLTAERDQLNQQLGAVNHRLQQMDGSAAAAEAEENQKQFLAQIRADAERYVRVKLAGSVLHTAIERYRDKIRGPVLKMAGELFRELTLNSFEGLRVDEDDRSNPVLVGLRAGSRQAVTMNGMSEGTCDQLYLALRLASLQLEAAPRSHLPFIVDDILIQFDDLRAAAALQVLSKLGRQRQVIFFTHHQHLLDVAAKHLPEAHSAHRLEGA